MSMTIEERNAMLRRAVEQRIEAQQEGKPSEEWYGGPVTETLPEEHVAEDLLQAATCCENYSEWIGPACASVETLPAEQLLLDALAVIRDRRPKYGGPLQHFKRTVGMINAAFGDILTRPLTEADWAIFMTLDKVARYCGPTKTSDGPIDLAGYAACLAEVEGKRG